MFVNAGVIKRDRKVHLSTEKELSFLVDKNR
jgi:flagellar biosynthesis regulator FlbT